MFLDPAAMGFEIFELERHKRGRLRQFGGMYW